jgi:hypothetical protein
MQSGPHLRFASLLPVALLVAAASCRHSPGTPSSARTELISRPAAITVDGDLADWKDATFRTVTPDTGIPDPATQPIDGPADLSFRFAVAHDAAALYVAVEVTDDAVTADSCEPESVSAPAWDDDAVEVFLDGNHNRAVDSRVPDGSELRYGGEFSLIANGAAMSDYSGYPKTFGTLWSGATNWDRVQRAEARRMVYEFRLPWVVMGRSEAPASIGFTLSVQDDDDGGRRDHALYWAGKLPSPFRDESGFGSIRFGGNQDVR